MENKENNTFRRNRYKYSQPTSREEVLNLGFIEIPHFTIGNSLIYNLSRNRYLTISSIGTPNEFLYIGYKENNEITDLICLHNYDYDGYITIEKIKNVLKIFNN